VGFYKKKTFKDTSRMDKIWTRHRRHPHSVLEKSSLFIVLPKFQNKPGENAFHMCESLDFKDLIDHPFHLSWIKIHLIYFFLDKSIKKFLDAQIGSRLSEVIFLLTKHPLLHNCIRMEK